jgi:hypothetical protein
MGRGPGNTMRSVVDALEPDRWLPVAQVVEHTATVLHIDTRTVQASVRRLMSRGLIEVSTCRSILPDLGGRDRLARRVCRDRDTDAIAQHSARVRLVFDELIAIREAIEHGGKRTEPRWWWATRDRAELLRRVLSRLVGRREQRRLLHAAGFPAQTPPGRPMDLSYLRERLAVGA